MSAVKLSSEEPFVYAIFGLQLPGGKEDPQKSVLKEQLDALIAPFATHLDRLVQDGCARSSDGTTILWLSYWKSQAVYQAWWNSDRVSRFWESLPTSAGMWREIMSPSASRTQYMTNKSSPAGLGHLGTEISVGNKTGYWGCYRHRMSAHLNDSFASPTLGQPALKSVNNNGPERVVIDNFPDNICFVVEGQDHSDITANEKKYWHDHLDSHATQWMKDLFSAGLDSGILGSRMCYAPETGRYRDSTPRALNYNKKVQLFYFQDLRHMERIGRTNKRHVELRKRFMQAYSPNGEMQSGKLGLWVETTVLKNGEIEAEYVGCEPGTGWMALASLQVSHLNEKNGY